MKKTIKSCQVTRFKSINVIMYEGSGGDYKTVDVHYKKGSRSMLMIASHRLPSNDYFPLNISGKIYDFRLCDEYAKYGSFCKYLPHACCHPYEDESVIKSIHSYLLDFFGNSVKYHWKTEKDNFIIPQLPNLLSCSIWLEDDSDTKALEEYFSSSSALKSIYLSVDEREELFSAESKFYQTEAIDIDQHHMDHCGFLSHFQGRQIYLSCYTCYVSDLITFVDRWQSEKHIIIWNT
ncbi:hypothetical protein B9Z55_000558 [Caenorhabditis nigoni]|nr:hypothetical protein B9Z55_000558 [Caenorhabditis nigoni]